MGRVSYWIKIVRGYARDYLLENTGLKVLALLITAVLWLSVASRPVSEITLHDVRVELHNMPDSPDLIVTKWDPLSFNVTLRGPIETLDSLRPNELSLYADMTGIEPGVRVISVKLDRNRLPANVEEAREDPRSIRVTVERVVEREVVVKPRFDGEPAPGYEVYNYQVMPSKTQISGASSRVRDINEVSTETVSLAGRTAPFSEVVAIDIGTPDVNIKGDEYRRVRLNVSIGETRKERVVERVPVSLVGAPVAARPEPRFVAVRVFGPDSEVDGLSPADINVSVEYRKGGPSSGLTPTVTLPGKPDSIKVRSVVPDVVRVTISGR